MRTKSSDERKGQPMGPVRVLAKNMGLNHETGPGRAHPPVRQAIGNLFDRVRGAGRKAA